MDNNILQEQMDQLLRLNNLSELDQFRICKKTLNILQIVGRTLQLPYITYLQSNILFDRRIILEMGNTECSSIRITNKPTEIDQKLSPIPLKAPTQKKIEVKEESIHKTKVFFHKFKPVIIGEEDNQTQKDNQVEEEPKPLVVQQEAEQQQAVDQSKMEIIEEIKIKWNTFIKMKRKNYLEDYSVIKQIGRGGFGCVYKVRAKYTGLYRAAKKIKKNNLAKGQHEKLFAEMAIMMALDHPNIGRLYQVYDYKSSYVLILQLCEGGQLFKKIVTNRINEPTASFIVKQIMQSLVYLHSQGIVHRDLKPENMLFEKGNENIKLIDFGIAIKIKPDQFINSRIGTPYYIAPQVLCKKYTQKCDIWSVGVILYMMLANQPPFGGQTQTEVMESVLRDDCNFKLHCFSPLSSQCKDFLKKILVKNPAVRLSAREALEHPWLKNASFKDTSFSDQKLIQKQSDSIISKIAEFKFANKLEAVVYTFIVSQVLTTDQKKIINDIFHSVDKNHDGVISIAELKQAILVKKYITQERAEFLMRIIDTNGSGQIDFTQFIVAALNKQELNESHFKQAFAYFDIDHSGFITYEQIAAFLDSKNSEDQIKKIFSDVDQNGDNEISQQQFITILMKATKELHQNKLKDKNINSPAIPSKQSEGQKVAKKQKKQIKQNKVTNRKPDAINKIK